MASAARIIANQANAQLSTGPRTPEGKARASANSRKDGLTARTLVISEEQQAEFDQFRLSLIRDTRPEGALEHEYFHRLLTCGWILRYARTLESQLLAETDPVHDEAAAARLHRISRYRRDLERSYDRALREFRHLQTDRAVLLQQSDAAVTALANVTPLAQLTRITSHTDPFLGHDNPLVPKPEKFFASRQAAERSHSAAADAQNEPIAAPFVDPFVSMILNDPALKTDEKRRILQADKEANVNLLRRHQDAGQMRRKPAAPAPPAK
jgi:hypothetical protein